ncbi:MAG: outer membrane beta-barrel protein [Crocinitomicaceae bacterium]|nr:outer membrane beta-barrel protein [Flavobacteriales bacterium]NQZ38220.1 outer membrane beta-barrel protein [Crocinitomicaceae bacterium]
MKIPIHAVSLFVICLLFSSFQVNAQEPVEVSGQVKDAQTKENLPYCKVVALNAKDSIVRGGITDENGFFRLPLNPGQYTIIISSYGYVNDTIQTGPFRKDNFLGVFKLESSVLDIDEVKVSASSRIDMLEKDVQIITDQQKKGSTAAKHVLDRIAGISYDEYAGVLKVDNDANIMILVNGVEKSQEYVQNLDPERLIRVETIRDPGGRYGLEGYTAIVNVILKRDYQGSELYIEQMQLVDIVPEHNRLDYMIGSIGATYNFTKNDLNIYGSAHLERRNFKITSESQTEYADGVVVLEEAEWRVPNAIILESDAYYTLGFDYRINPKHLISFESNIQALPLSVNQENIDYQTSVYSNDTLIEKYAFSLKNKTRTFNIYNTFFYIAEFNERTKLNVNFTYSNYKDDYTNTTSQEGYYDRVEVGINKKQYTRAYAELDHILSKRTSVQVGYGNTWRELKNEYSVSVTDPNTAATTDFTNDFRLTDMRHKLYSNFSWKIGKKWSARVGLAAETSTPRVDDQQLNYLIFQPMFDLRFAAGEKINYILKYRTSSSYPTIAETNPFTNLLNPRITSTGNPYLTPSTTHRFSLRINIMQGLLSLEPYSHYSNNRIANVGELDANNIFNFRYENAKSYTRNGAKLNFSKFFKPGIIVQSNVEVYHSKIVSTSTTNSLIDWRADVDLIYMFMKTEAMLGLKYQRQQSKNISGLGYNKGDVDFWLLFYQRPLFKKRASIMVGYFLPLDFGTNYNQGFHAETNGIMMHTDNDVSLVKNMFLVEFSFRLSKGKSIKKTEKDIQQEKEASGGGMF